MEFELNLGTNDLDGADGMTFILHNDPTGTSALATGGPKLGAHSILNGIAIEFDTYDRNGINWVDENVTNYLSRPYHDL